MQLGNLVIDPPLILAPMAGITNAPFRIITARFGAPLCFSEMVSSEGVTRSDQKGTVRLVKFPGEGLFGVQVFGADPDRVAEAVKIAAAAPGVAVIDINMGCPVRKVVKSGSGAALTRNLALAADIIAAARAATSLPLTIKTRLGWDHRHPSVLELGRIAREEGADALTIHARTAKQGFSGRADWAAVAEAVDRLDLPVIGNGDVASPEDARDMLARTGCAGVMIGRAARGNPWLFEQAAAVLAGRPPREIPLAERHRTALDHARLLAEHVGEKRASLMLRGLLAHYSRGLPGASAFRAAVNAALGLDPTLDAVNRFFEAAAGAVLEPPPAMAVVSVARPASA